MASARIILLIALAIMVLALMGVLTALSVIVVLVFGDVMMLLEKLF
jgi:hypothetical protein